MGADRGAQGARGGRERARTSSRSSCCARAQALEFRRPLPRRRRSRRCTALVRARVPAHAHDRTLAPEIEALAEPRRRSGARSLRPPRRRAASLAVTRMLTQARDDDHGIAARTIRAPRGTQLSCKGWLQEAALRMLMNNLDPEVAERPEDLVVYGGTGKAARNWECFDAIVARCASSRDDETLLVQSGKPVGVFRTHADAPRVLIANSNLVPHWATWEHFRELERKGLMMYGQMTAGSWIYIGTQGILQGTYETFAEARAPALRRHRSRDGWCSPAGSAAWAARSRSPSTMNGACCSRSRSTRSASSAGSRRATSTRRATTSTRRSSRAREAHEARRPLSVGLLGQRRRRAARARRARRRARRRHRPDVARTIRSTATCPNGMTLDAGARAARERSRSVRGRGAPHRWPSTCAPCWTLQGDGRRSSSTTATTSARRRSKAGVANAFDFPGFVPAYIRPLFCEGKGPFRWAALSGDPADIAATDDAVLETFPEDDAARAAGSGSRASASRSRACPRASAGSATASGRSWASSSTSWCARARCRRRS